MPARTQVVESWLPLHSAATVATLPVPTDDSGGGAIPATWFGPHQSRSVMVRLSKADAAMSLANMQLALFVKDTENSTGAWYLTGPILNGGTAVVLTSIGYMIEVPVCINIASRIALVGTPTGVGAFAAAAALVVTTD